MGARLGRNKRGRVGVRVSAICEGGPCKGMGRRHQRRMRGLKTWGWVVAEWTWVALKAGRRAEVAPFSFKWVNVQIGGRGEQLRRLLAAARTCRNSCAPRLPPRLVPHCRGRRWVVAMGGCSCAADDGAAPKQAVPPQGCSQASGRISRAAAAAQGGGAACPAQTGRAAGHPAWH